MKLRPFELALVIIFMVLMIMALFLLATYNPPPSEEDLASLKNTVSIWGTLPEDAMEAVLESAVEIDESFALVEYEYHNPNDFDWQLINALADGVGPDIVLFSHEKLVSLRKRIAPIPYETLPLTDIRSGYLDGAEIFALSDGMYAIPVAVDPLLLYWNRDILSTEGFIQPPVTWEQLVNNMFPDLIKRDFDRTIRRGVVAMGEYNNVRNAFGTVSMLLIQSGSALVIDNGKGYTIELDEQINDSRGAPLNTTADFYTRFSQPSNNLYSWNRAQAEDRSEFIAEDLALYFGFGSEGREIEELNPNLNFAAVEVPQGAAANVRRTYGKFYGLSVLKTSDNFNESLRVAYALGSTAFAEQIARESNMVPVAREAVSSGSNDIYARTAYLSAPIARGWLNPDLAATNNVFATMVADINENRRKTSEAVKDALGRLGLEYKD